MEAKELKKLLEAGAKSPQVRMLVTAVKNELETVLHPPMETPDDIEAALDESYQRILQQNKKSELLKQLVKLFSDILQDLAARNGIEL